MSDTKSNIEAVARAVCERQLHATGMAAADVSLSVGRYWHCVAAEIEAGLIDESGNRLLTHDFHADREAYRDWCRRHPAG